MLIDTVIRSPSLVEQVCQQLAALIRKDQAEDDGWLPTERGLSEQLGVSRGVVREAAKRLESQGLIEIHHGIGIKAVDKLHKPLSGSLSLSIPDETERLRQLNEARLAIEPEVARLAADNATQMQVRALKRLHRDLEAAADSAAAVAADMAFHHALAEASGNQIFGLILDSLADLGKASRQLTIGNVGKQRAIDQHAEILAAVELRRPEAAARAMRSHVLEARKDLASRVLKVVSSPKKTKSVKRRRK